MKQIILLIVLAIISQVVAAVKKSQAEARRRALEAQAPRPRPPTRRAAPPPPEEDDDLDEMPEEETVELGAPEREWEMPALRPPPLVATQRPFGTSVPTQLLNIPTTSVSPARWRHTAIRFDRKRLKDAIVMMEVIGPPVSMR